MNTLNTLLASLLLAVIASCTFSASAFAQYSRLQYDQERWSATTLHQYERHGVLLLSFASAELYRERAACGLDITPHTTPPVSRTGFGWRARNAMLPARRKVYI